MSNLQKQSAATQAELDTAQTRYNAAKAAVAEAEAMSGYAKIVAPFDAVVARKLADEGDLAMPGRPLLESEGRAGLRLVADVPNLITSQVRPNAKLWYGWTHMRTPLPVPWRRFHRRQTPPRAPCA